ncbi:MAG: phenylalanine--tRNA ligase subunit beta, partial [Synergistaceae bacterium]|nr:phenylalanine--tRNA ligase subunit beta [Synergistaceae bacterium]
DFHGVMSYGMMLSAEELGLHDVDDPSGLLILPKDAQAGDDARNLYHIGDVILDVSITPNRGDTLSLLGMAREIKGLYPHSRLKAPYWMEQFTQNQDWCEDFGSISLPDKGCFCYRLGLATGAKISDSPLTAKIDLAHLGMRPINNAVDVTNYVMLMLGQPLHAFDLNTLPAREITVRAAHQDEHMTTLDGKDRALTERDMLITSGGQAIAIAGVMGGELTGINPDTSTIVIESACFSPVRVGHTSRRLGINSEAAFRFSRTVDPNLSSIALISACALLREWCGAKVDYAPLSAENEFTPPHTVNLTRRKLATYLSWDDMHEAARILSGFGIKHIKDDAETSVFMPPTWRPDITIEEDLIEEIGRFRGYNNAPDALPSEMPKRADIGEHMRLSSHIRQFMLARGYTELLTYSFLPEDFPKLLRLTDDDLRSNAITIANPISIDQSAMRTTLLPGLLAGLKLCIDAGYREPVRAFEQGRVFLKAQNGHIEPEHLAAILYNGKDTRSATGTRTEGFYELKGDVEALMRSRGYDAEFRAGTQSFMHSGQSADILINGECIGYAGRLKPAIEQVLGAEGVYVFEADVKILTEAVKPEYSSGSAFPASYRDISLLVSESKPNEAVMQDIRDAVKSSSRDGVMLEGLRLFDVYAGEGIPSGFRSMAYALSYRSRERTLTVEEVEAVHSGVREALKAQGYIIR